MERRRQTQGIAEFESPGPDDQWVRKRENLEIEPR